MPVGIIIFIFSFSRHVYFVWAKSLMQPYVCDIRKIKGFNFSPFRFYVKNEILKKHGFLKNLLYLIIFFLFVRMNQT